MNDDKLVNLVESEGSIADNLITDGNYDVNKIMVAQIKPHIEDIQKTYKESNSNKNLSVMNVFDYIDKFLMLHLGYPEADSQYDNTLGMEFAGGQYRPVNLIDSEGKIVAQVPSLYPEGFYDLGSREESIREMEETNGNVESLGKKMDDIANYGENYKHQADEMRNELYSKLGARMNSSIMEEHKKKWRDFFKVMGLIKDENEDDSITHDIVKNDSVNSNEIVFISEDDDDD